MKIIDKIFPAKKLQKKYKLYAENRPTIKLNPNKVPKEFITLIPFAEKWGIGDDIIRSDYEEKVSEEEKINLKNALQGKVIKINKWLDSFKNKEMSEESAAFMYMLLAAEEIGIYPKTKNKKTTKGDKHIK